MWENTIVAKPEEIERMSETMPMISLDWLLPEIALMSIELTRETMWISNIPESKLVGGLDSGAVDAIADSISVFEARTGHGDLISLTWDKNPNRLDGQPIFEFTHWLHLPTLPCWSQRVTETKQKHISSGCIKLSMRDKFQEVHVWLSSAWNGWFAVDEETR